MFKDTKAFSSFSVDDLQKAKAFYTDTLGLDVEEYKDMGGMLSIHIAGGTNILVYPKPDHTPTSFTILNFPVDDVEKAVTGLKEKGVAFENYDSEELKTDDDSINRNEGMQIAWFKDPAGNFLSVLKEKK